MSCRDDLTFGPAVSGCRGGFDFTIEFEDIVLSLVPSLLFIVSSIASLWRLCRAEPVSRCSCLCVTKLVVATAYSALQLSILITGTRLRHETQLSTAARSAAFVSSAFILPLTVLEDRCSKRPSFLLCVYLLFSILFDIVQVRTRWLEFAELGQSELLGRLLTAAVALKFALLVLESRQKAATPDSSPEETAGPFSLATYSWLDTLFLKSYHHVLSLDDLYPLNAQITSKGLCERLSSRMSHAHSAQPMPRFGLAKSLARTLLVPLLLGVLPRLALVGFRFCQPFLLNNLLNHLKNTADQDSAWKNTSYGFIGATVFIYLGVAVSSAIYWYCHERFISMTRGALVATIYQKLTQLRTVDVSDSAAVTLMSTDIERIRVGLLSMHEFWGSSLEVTLASWLLYRQLGVAFVAPLVFVVCSVVCSLVLNRHTGPLQKVWMNHIQTRVAETAQMLSNLKQLKVSGLALSVEESTQQLRVDELNASSKFRRLYVSNMAFGFAPMALCPVITFAITARNIDTSTIYTSLAYLVLLAEPLGVLFGEIPYFLAAFTSLERIQEFISKEPQVDDRLFVSPGSSTSDTGLKPCSGPSISIENAQIGWLRGSTVFQNTSIRVPASGLTMLIGPVGSGKSTLCKALLAEVPLVRGIVNVGAGSDQFKTSFCDQTPYIYNGSIRDNITGFSGFDKARYQEVAEAVMLYPDFMVLPQGDGTIVGSGGITLSGGQKQRIGLARALYSNANFCVFDDSLSGLDTNTELQVFNRVFGPDGILRQRQSTVVLAAHNTKYMPLAKHIVVLGGDGVISYAGDYAGLDSKGVQQLTEQLRPEAQAERALQQDGIRSQEPSAVDFLAAPESQATPTNASFLSERDRMMGDATVYRYYLASLGKLSIIAFAVFGMGWGFFYNFGYIWLEFWSKDSSQHHSKAFYLGLYGLWQVGGLVSVVLCFWTSYTVMVRTSSSRLHRAALRTVVHAPLSFLTTTDVGVITNLFSQDMTLVDNELPEALTNLAMDIWNALGTAAVIATSSLYLVISYPILVAILYFVQKFYLRTSRQLRLLELEAKSPLYTHFLDTAKGLATIRSFNWAEDSIKVAIKLLDKSQKPTYLLAMARRWLLFVLQCIVAVLAIVVVTLATQVSSGTSGFTGASLVALMTFGDTLNYIIRWWTQLETSIGAVTRLKSLSDNVPLESFGDETQPLDPEWPAHGDMKITDVSAAYHAPNQQQPASEQEKQPHLVLKGFSATIAAGEKVAVCGRSGSGKSSMILLLLRMLDPLPSCPQGIVIDGVGLHSIARADVRERIIAMSQDPVFLPGEISLKRQLDPFNLSTLEECHAVLQLVGLDSLAPESVGLEVGLRPESLSGGQRQLFSLARTILRGRARSRGRQRHGGEKVGGIVLLDEVSASVDKRTEQIMHRIIMDEFVGYTIIMVAHHLDVVMDFDTVLVMEQGRVVERGQPKVLVAEEHSHFGQLRAAGRNGQR